MLQILFWNQESADWSIGQASDRLQQNPETIRDAIAILDFLAESATVCASDSNDFAPLEISGRYTTSEILAGLEHWSMTKRPSMREGALHLADKCLDVSFITLQKTEADYSPTTMYEDYFVSQELFHWQSQSRTSVESPTGQRYIHHKQHGYTPLLFVRDTRKTTAGNTSPYYFLGPCEYVSHQGSRPISITWRLQHRVPMPTYRLLNQQVAG